LKLLETKCSLYKKVTVAAYPQLATACVFFIRFCKYSFWEVMLANN